MQPRRKTPRMSDPFDPSKMLTKVSGQDYLEVKWRLVWLRDRHPDAVIETELILHDDKKAIFKATVSLPGPAGSATGFGSETPGDFRDYIEKAETKAIGRALAALGFGTQFSQDHVFGADAGRVVDSPVQRNAPPRDRSTTRNTVPEPPRATESRATPKPAQDHALVDQKGLTALFAVTKDRSVSNEDLHAIARKRYGVESLKDLRVDHARDLYLLFQKESDEGLQHELYLATSEPGAGDEPAEAVLTPRTSNPMFS